MHHSAPLLGYPGLVYNARTDLDAMARVYFGADSAAAKLLTSLNIFGLLSSLIMYILLVPLLAPICLLAFPLLLLPPTRRLALRLIAENIAYPGDPASRVVVRTRGRGANGSVVRTHVEIAGGGTPNLTNLICPHTHVEIADDEPDLIPSDRDRIEIAS